MPVGAVRQTPCLRKRPPWLWSAGCLLVLGVSLSAATAAAGAPRLREIRCMGGRDYSRLVLDLSEPVAYRLQRVPPADGNPARVHVDLLGARLVPNRAAPGCEAAGPLSAMHVVQTNRGVRLVLDVPRLTGTRAFPLLDPFRLVVDVESVAARPSRLVGLPTPALSALPRVPVPSGGPSKESAEAPERLKIVIDPGHGGKDPGARGVGGILEKDVVLAVARRLRDDLQRLPGIDVVLTRDSDVFLSLEERTARANAERADLFVSIHANASVKSSTSGVETYYLNNTNDRATLRLAAMENGLASVTGHRQRDREAALLLSSLIQSYKVPESAALATSVQGAVVSSLESRWSGVVDLGVKQGPFYVLVGAGMPCILVEVSFLTNPEEGARLAEAPYQQMIADGLRRGIERFLDKHAAAGTL
jgi:N-acetylmuramoyl-L-alanine amidase